MSLEDRFRNVWSFCFVGTALAAAATAIPILGIVANLLGAQAWPILLLNIGFIALAGDGIYSRSRSKLTLSSLWFGGYALLAIVSHAQLALVQSRAAKLDQPASIAWDRELQSILLSKDGTSSENFASDITPAELVQKYGLDVVYSGSYADAPAQRVSIERHDCPERGISINGDMQFRPIRRGGYPEKSPMQTAWGVCLVFATGASAPANPLRVHLDPVRPLTGLLDGISQDLIIETSGRPPQHLRVLQAAPLPWVPMPILGCHYKGGFGDAWDRGCHAEFAFPSWRNQGNSTPMETLTRVLGLRPMTIEQRLPGVVWK